MLVNENIIEELCLDAGSTRTQKAKKYQMQGKVLITKVEYENKDNFELHARVFGTEQYDTYVEVKNGEVEEISCDCPDYYNTYGVCKHSLATVLEFNENGFQDIINPNKIQKQNNIASRNSKKVNKYNSFHQIVKTLYNEELDEIDSDIDVELKNKGTIKIEPQIIYDKFTREMKIEFKIGNKRMYKIKNLAEFYTRMINKEFYKYGDKLEFVHTQEVFEENSQKMLDFIMKYAEVIAYTNSSANSNYRYYGKALNESSIIIGNTAIDELFETLENKTVLITREYEKQSIKFVNQNPDLTFRLEKVGNDEYRIIADFDVFKIVILNGKKYKYVLTDENLYRCNKEFEKTTLRLLKVFRENFLTQISLGKDELGELFSVVLSKVKNAIKIEPELLEEIKEYEPEKLGVKVFLDYDKNNYLVADVRLCYGENEFNPLNSQEEKEFKYSRNLIEETKAMNIFRKTGFMFDVQNLKFILPDEDKIYEFLTNDINYYMKKFEVLATENFKTKEVSKLSVIDNIFEPEKYPDLYGDVYHKVRINYYPPRKDNKEAWDNIDIFGWMGYPMEIKVNFLCRDSILAAPIALDLVLFSDLALRAGMCGIQTWLSFFCKSPMHDFEHQPVHDLFTQWRMVKETLRNMIGEKAPSYLD